MKKHLMYVLLILSLCFTLCSCANTTQPMESVVESTAETTVVESEPTVEPTETIVEETITTIEEEATTIEEGTETLKEEVDTEELTTEDNEEASISTTEQVENADTATSTHPVACDENGNVIFTFPASNDFINNANIKHNYYLDIPIEDIQQCEIVAMSIAYEILCDPAYTTDLQKINRAAQIVKTYCDHTTYSMDTANYYRSPIGLYTNTYYTCAGSTRTLGRILDFMGYEWTHANENQDVHQWCIVNMDGQIGWADGMGGMAAYGELENGMTINGGVVTFKE